MTRSQWREAVKTALGSCLCGYSARSSSPEPDGESQHQHRSGRTAFARDELEGLLAAPSSDEEADVVSLRSDVGHRNRKKRRRKGKLAWGISSRQGSTKRPMQVFGWYPFGKPVGPIEPQAEDDEAGPSTRRDRALSVTTFDSDADPLDHTAIAQLNQSLPQFEPPQTDADLEREEQEQAEREEAEAAALRVPSLPTAVEVATPEPAVEVHDHAERIRKAARLERRRRREEAAIRAQEEMERRAEAAAGGFDDENGVEFGDFEGPNAQWAHESQLQAPSGPGEPQRSTSDDGVDEDDLGLDYGAEYAHRSTRKSDQGDRSGSEGSKSMSGTSASRRSGFPPSHLRPDDYPLPPSSVGSNTDRNTSTRRKDFMPDFARPPSSVGSSTDRGPLTPSTAEWTRRKDFIPAHGRSNSDPDPLARLKPRKGPKTHRSQGSASSRNGTLLFHPLSGQPIEFDGVPGEFEGDAKPVPALGRADDFDGTPGGF